MTAQWKPSLRDWQEANLKQERMLARERGIDDAREGRGLDQRQRNRHFISAWNASLWEAYAGGWHSVQGFNEPDWHMQQKAENAARRAAIVDAMPMEDMDGLRGG
jgi:hypothetical protein